jgi:hypothetical protein
MRQHDGTRPGHAKIGALVKHPTAWDAHAVRGMLAMHGVKIPRSMGC